MCKVNRLLTQNVYVLGQRRSLVVNKMPGEKGEDTAMESDLWPQLLLTRWKVYHQHRLTERKKGTCKAPVHYQMSTSAPLWGSHCDEGLVWGGGGRCLVPGYFCVRDCKQVRFKPPPICGRYAKYNKLEWPNNSDSWHLSFCFMLLRLAICR